MYTWISRVMLLVFTFQLFGLQFAQAQTRRGRSSKKTASTEDLQKKVHAAAEQAHSKPFSKAKTLDELDKLYNKQREKLIDLYDTIDVTNNPANYAALYRVVVELHKLSDEYSSHLVRLAVANDATTIAVASLPPPSIVNDNTYMGSWQRLMKELETKNMPFCSIYNDITSAETSIEDVVEILDPFQETKRVGDDDSGCQAVAAEILSHHIDSQLRQSTLSEEEHDFWMEYLPRLTARLQYSYKRLPRITASTKVTDILTTGSFRVLLYKMHQLYNKLVFPDPLTWVQTTSDEIAYKICPTEEAYNDYMAFFPQQTIKTEDGIERGVLTIPSTGITWIVTPPFNEEPTLERFKKAGTKTIQGKWSPSVKIPKGYECIGVMGTHDNADLFFHNLLEEFKREFRALNNGAKPGSNAYAALHAQMQMMLEYAINIGETDVLETVINALSPGAPENLLIENSELLQTAFNVIGTTLLDLPAPNPTFSKVKEKIVKWAGPGNGTAVRLLAIGMAGLIHQAGENAHREETDSKAYLPLDPSMEHIDLQFSEQSRETLVKYAADFYGSLNPNINYSENFSIEELNAIRFTKLHPTRMPSPLPQPKVESDTREFGTISLKKYPTKTFGLNSQQMNILQDQIAADIRNLLPVHAPDRMWSENAGRYGPSTLYPGHLLFSSDFPDEDKRLMPPWTGYSFKSPADYPYAVPTYIYDSKGRIVTICSHNAINWEQEALERVQAFEELICRLLFEAIMWVVGGKVLEIPFVLLSRLFITGRGMVVMLPAAYRSSRTVARSMRLAGKSAKEIRKAQIGRFSSKLRQGRQFAVKLSNRGQSIGSTVTSTTRMENVKGTQQAINKAVNKQQKIQKQIDNLSTDPNNIREVANLREKAAQLAQDVQRMSTQMEKAAITLEKNANKLAKQAKQLRRKAGKRSGKTGDRLRQQADDLEQQAAALREQATQVRAGTGSYTADVTRAGYKYAGPRSRSAQREAERWTRRMRNKMKGQTPHSNVGWNVSQHRPGYDLREIYIDAAKYRLEYANPGSWSNILDNARFWRAFAREGGELTRLGRRSLFRAAEDGSLSVFGKQVVGKDGFVRIFGKEVSLLGKPIKVSISPREKVLEWFIYNPMDKLRVADEMAALAAIEKGISNMDGSVAFFTSQGERVTFEQVWTVMRQGPQDLAKSRAEFLRFLDIKPNATMEEIETVLNAFQTKWTSWQSAYERVATRLAGGKIPAGKRDAYFRKIDEMLMSGEAPDEFKLLFENPKAEFLHFQQIFRAYEEASPEFFYAIPLTKFPNGKIPAGFNPTTKSGITKIIRTTEETSKGPLLGEATVEKTVSEWKQMFDFLAEYSRYSGVDPLTNNWFFQSFKRNLVMFTALYFSTDKWLYDLMEKQTDYRYNKQYEQAREKNDPSLDHMQDELGYVVGESDATNLFARLDEARSRTNEHMFTTFSFLWPVPSQNPIPDLLWTDLLTDEDRANIKMESIRTTCDYLITLRDWNTQVQKTNEMLASKRADYEKARSLATDPELIKSLDALLAALDQAEQEFNSFSTDPKLTLAQKNTRFAQWAELTELTTAENDFQRGAFAKRVSTAHIDLAETRQHYEDLLEDDTDGTYTDLIKRVLSEITKMEQQLDAIVASEQDVFEKQNALDEWLEQPALQKAIEALRQKQLEAETADYLEALNQKRQELQASLTGQELADELTDIDQTEQALREIMQKPGTTKQKYAALNNWQIGHFNEKAEQQHQRLEEHYASLKHELDQAIVHGNLKEVRRLKQMFTQQEQYATLLRNIQESSANVSYKDMWLAWWKDGFPNAAALTRLQEQLSFVNADEKTRQEWMTAQTSFIRSGILYSPVEKYAFLTEQLEAVEGYSEDACASVLFYSSLYSSYETTYPDLSDKDKDFWAKHQIDSTLYQLTEGPFSFGKKIEAFGEDAIAQRDELWRSAQEKIDNVYNDKKLTLQQKQTQYSAIRSSFSLDLQTLWNGLATAAQRETDELLPNENSTTSPIIH